MGRHLIKPLRGLAWLLCGAAAAAWGYSFINDVGRGLPGRSGEWEIVCRSGRLTIDNKPQRLDEMDRAEAARASARIALRLKEAELRRALDQSPYGSDEYREALQKVKALDAGQKPASREAPADPATPAVQHSIPAIVTALTLAIAIAILAFSGRRGEASLAANQPPIGRRRVGAFETACMVSLLLAALTAWAWIDSYRHLARLALVTRTGEYSVMAEQGRVMFAGPPPLRKGGDGAIREWVTALSNADIEWTVRSPETNPRFRSPPGVRIDGMPAPDTPASELLKPDRDYGAEVPDLLIALRDPRRAVAAHVVLTRQMFARTLSSGRGPIPLSVYLGEGVSWYNERYNGLRLPLTDSDRTTDQDKTLDRLQFDLSQLPAIRDKWHRLYDRISRPVPAWLIFIACLALPLAWTGRSVRRSLNRRNLRRLGSCLACGYDLTGNTSGVCPECGAACKAADPAGVSPAAGD